MIPDVDDEAGGPARSRSGASDRYQFEALLGQGGMAVVHRVLDRATGRRIALKRLRVASGDNPERAIVLFEREYLTLTQLAHPRVVEAYDYGVDEQGPYYTMELLDDGDLQSLSPLAWRRVCTLARDVCSALALLHSRRMVYRDLSPRNVRCTSDGLAKLIDFGAMTPMGPSRELVGTLPFVPPEALNQQPLDARTDLYALGATLYYTLVQRHAYPARDVSQLRDFWRSRPRRPSELVPGIPEALDCLIMDLMHLDPAVRPANAAEVMAKLGAIAGLRASEQVLVSQAYLSNPTLVGRGTVLAQARKLTLRALHQRGVAMMIRGAPGLGRSRLLDACVLEAKLAGLTVLRADSTDAQKGSYGVLRSLASQLLKAVPLTAHSLAQPELALLGHAVPELLPRDGEEVQLEHCEDPQQLHRRVQQALRHWLLEVSRARPLLLAIDDLPRIDESSAACVALLAQHVADHAIVIASSVGNEDIEESPVRGAVELLAGASTMFEVEPLTLELTEQLLGSVFGEVPNLHLVARYVQQVSGGNPRDIMRLAQHLVTEQVVQYQAGAWSLPAQLDASSLPASMADAMHARIEHLTVDQRQLALAFACEPGLTFSFEECAALAPNARAARTAYLMQALDLLVSSDVLLYAGERYSLRQQGWIAPITAVSTLEQIHQAHLRLAAVFEQRGGGFRVAQHLLKGGELDRGLDALLVHAAESEQRTDASSRAFYELLQSLPRDWLSTYEHALQVCEQHARPLKQRDALLSRLNGLVAHAVTETDGYAYIEARLEQLRIDSGLDLYAELPSTLDPGAKLKKALEEATARFLRTPERERVLDPGSAIKQLPKCVLAAVGTISFTSDYSAWCRIPSLTPLIPLSPTIAVVQHLVDGVGARIAGRSEAAIATYETLLERIAQPDHAGLTTMHHLATHMRVTSSIGTLEAAMGRASSLERADQVAQEAFFAPQAMFIRHIYHVWQGDTGEAARCKQQIEIVRIESNGQYGFEGQHLLSELAAYSIADDMTRVKRATDAVEPRAQIHRAWQPVLHFGRGEYQRIRGDYQAALEQFEQALALIPDGHHQIWANLAGAHLRTLSELGQHEEAIRLGSVYLQQAEGLELGFVRNYIRMPLSLALSKAREHAAAVALAETVIDDFVRLGSTGLNLAAAYETRARIALEAGDEASFERHSALFAEQSRGRLLSTKYQRAAARQSTADPSVLDEFSIVSQFTSTLENCQTSAQRARCGLEYLGRQSGASAGLLYTNSDSGLICTASFGELEPSPELDRWAREYFERELEDEADDTAAFSEPPDEDAPDARFTEEGQRLVPVLLSHQAKRGFAITGVALLITDADTHFTYPSRIAAELSRSVASAGDVEEAYT